MVITQNVGYNKPTQPALTNMKQTYVKHHPLKQHTADGLAKAEILIET